MNVETLLGYSIHFRCIIAQSPSTIEKLKINCYQQYSICRYELSYNIRLSRYRNQEELLKIDFFFMTYVQ